MIVSFYSYKGGVGRTQLLANLAAYLCYFEQKRILVIDWDLEAPGIDYYLKIDRQDIKKGLIDVFSDYVNYVLGKQNNQIDTSELPFFDESYILQSPLSTNGGIIDYIAAGNYNSNDYYIQVEDFNWYQFYQLQGGNVFIEFLKQQLNKLPYDFIFIDSRTGVTDYSGICNIQFPDINVVVVAPNEQNMKGAREMINRIIKSPYLHTQIDNKPMRQALILPILSRLDLTVERESERWQQNMKTIFGDVIAQTLQLLNRDPYIMGYIGNTLLHHTIEMAYNEQIIFEPNSRSSNDYNTNRTRTLATQFENIALLLLNKQTTTPSNERPEALYHRALSLRYSENYTAAAELLRQTISLKPDYNEAWFELGIVYEKLKDYEQAIAAYQKAINLKPDYNEAWNNLGSVYKTLEDYEQAIAAYQKAIHLKPDNHEAWNNLGTVYADGLKDYKQAIAAFQKTINIKPDLHEAWYNLGIVYNTLISYEQAITAYLKAITIKPDYHEAWNNLGGVYDDIKDYERAIAAYQKAINIKPDDHKAWNNLGLVYADGLKNYERAIAAYQKAINVKPDDHKAWNNLGLVFYNLKNYEQAIAAYQEAINIKPDYNEAWTNLGLVYATGLKDYEQAHFCYQEALGIKPDDENTFYNIACAYSQQQQKTNALHYLQKAIALNPNEYKAMAKQDTDFEWLWADEAFVALTS